MCRYFTFLEQAHLDWQKVTPDDLVCFVQWLRDPLRQVGVLSLHTTSPLSEKSVNTIVTAVSSFYRYQIQRGETLTNPVLYEQISNRFSGFKPFLIHTSRGKTVRRVTLLITLPFGKDMLPNLLGKDMLPESASGLCVVLQ